MSINVNSTDEELALAAKSGDQEAYRILWERCKPSVRGYLFKMMRELDVTESLDDVLQGSFLRAFTRLDKWDGTRKFFPWLVQVAKNYCINTSRDRINRNRILSTKVYPAEFYSRQAEDPSELAERNLQSEAVWKIIDGLELQESRDIMKWHYIDDLSFGEIGEKLGLREWHIRHKLSMIYKNLAKNEELKAYYVAGE